eukprot:3483993-Pleurochrysis_carterae.AAC.3
MHLTSPDVLALLRDDEHGALRVVHTGVRLFDRDSAKGTGCDFRACQSGLPILLPYLRTQVGEPCKHEHSARAWSCTYATSLCSTTQNRTLHPFRALHADGLAEMLRPHFHRTPLVCCWPCCAQRAALPAGLISQLLTESTMPKSAWEHQSKSLIACQPGSVVLETTAADGLSLALTALKTPGGAILPMISKAERQAILTQLAGVSNSTRTE